MELVFLGTGAGLPAKERNVTSIALHLLEEIGATWLFDCGEATQHQILQTAVRPRRIEKIFITHLHGDHIFGLPGLLSSRSFQGGDSPVTIYGPVGIREYVETSLRMSATHLQYEVNFVEIAGDGVLFTEEKFTVEVRQLIHGVRSYGYRIVEHDLPGRLLIENITAPRGPWLQQLKEGHDVTLADGTVLRSADYVAPPYKGRVVTILGDTRYCEASRDLARDADVLVHEATFGAADGQLAHNYFHSTSHEAATIAHEAGAKQLLLTHISARYVGKLAEQLVDEARTIFPNTQLMHDFSTVAIERHKAVY